MGKRGRLAKAPHERLFFLPPARRILSFRHEEKKEWGLQNENLPG
jgi:hypothetical protein